MPNRRSRILSAATCCLILLALCDGVRVDASFTSSIYENQVWNDATNSGIFGNAGNYTVSPQYTSGSYDFSVASPPAVQWYNMPRCIFVLINTDTELHYGYAYLERSLNGGGWSDLGVINSPVNPGQNVLIDVGSRIGWSGSLHNQTLQFRWTIRDEYSIVLAQGTSPTIKLWDTAYPTPTPTFTPIATPAPTPTPTPTQYMLPWPVVSILTPPDTYDTYKKYTYTITYPYASEPCTLIIQHSLLAMDGNPAPVYLADTIVPNTSGTFTVTKSAYDGETIYLLSRALSRGWGYPIPCAWVGDSQTWHSNNVPVNWPIPNTPTPTKTNTPIPTNTPTWTPTPTATNTYPPDVTPPPTNPFPPTWTPTPTATSTFTPTFTNTPTNTNTPTVTPTPTNTLPPDVTPPPTATFTNTPTRTNTPTNTNTPTRTSTPTPTNTYTSTPMPPAPDATLTPTVTVTPQPLAPIGFAVTDIYNFDGIFNSDQLDFPISPIELTNGIATSYRLRYATGDVAAESVINLIALVPEPTQRYNAAVPNNFSFEGILYSVTVRAENTHGNSNLSKVLYTRATSTPTVTPISPTYTLTPTPTLTQTPTQTWTPSPIPIKFRFVDFEGNARMPVVNP